jgi:hypothetical protein
MAPGEHGQGRLQDGLGETGERTSCLGQLGDTEDVAGLRPEQLAALQTGKAAPPLRTGAPSNTFGGAVFEVRLVGQRGRTAFEQCELVGMPLVAAGEERARPEQ